jgi:hypothetical protein
VEKWTDVASQPDFLSTKGVTLPLQAGQGIRFSVANSPHTVTVDKIEGDHVTFTLRSTPQTHSLRIGETGRYDVNEDGQPDITATLVSVTDNTANITFANITSPATSSVTDEKSSPSAIPPSKKPATALIAGAIGLAIVILGIIGLIVKNRRSTN